MATSSRIMHHVTKLKSSQTGFLNMTMSSLYSNGLHSHQISIQQSIFGMWWNGRFASWMCSRQICSNCVMLSCQYGPKSLNNVSNTLLNLCHEELRQFWRQKGIQPGTSKVHPIKLASECLYAIYSQKICFKSEGVSFFCWTYMLFWRTWKSKELLVLSDIHRIFFYYQSQCGLATVCLPTFFKISSFVFSTWKKLIQVWDNMWVSKQWQKLNLWVNFPFNESAACLVLPF